MLMNGKSCLIPIVLLNYCHLHWLFTFTLVVLWNKILPLFLSSLCSSDNMRGSFPDLKNKVLPIFSRIVRTEKYINKVLPIFSGIVRTEKYINIFTRIVRTEKYINKVLPIFSRIVRTEKYINLH